MLDIRLTNSLYCYHFTTDLINFLPRHHNYRSMQSLKELAEFFSLDQTYLNKDTTNRLALKLLQYAGNYTKVLSKG